MMCEGGKDGAQRRWAVTSPQTWQRLLQLLLLFSLAWSCSFAGSLLRGTGPPPAPSLTLFLPPRPNVKWQESLWGQENRLRGVVNIFLGFWNVDEGLPSFNNWTPPGWKPERCGFKC